MCDCCVNPFNDCANFCNNCPPPCYYGCRRACSTEYPRQRGCFAEEKFSNLVPPSFLCKDANDFKRDRERSKSCGCNIKTRKISANCKCKKKNIDCFAKDRVCEKSCGDGSGSGAGGGAGAGSDGNNVSEDDNACVNSYRANGCDNEIGNIICPDVSILPNQSNLCQGTNGWGAMPAAGMPTKKGARFDPCTGVECDYSQRDGPTDNPCRPCNVPPQPDCMFPCFPNPFAGCPNFMAPNFGNIANGGPCNSQPDKCSEQSQNSEEQSKKNKREKCAQAGEKRRASMQNDESDCNVKWTNVTPQILERICDSLGVPQPPNNCNILLPITMTNVEQKSAKSKTSRKASTGSISSVDNKREKSKNKNNNNNCKPTRNCGSNTAPSAKSQEGSSESSTNRNSNNAAANNNNNNNGNGCSNGMCCHRPQYTCCYNPYTGYYYWCRTCCCCNSCNSCNNCCGGPCPTPNTNSSSTDDVQKKPKTNGNGNGNGNAAQKSKKTKCDGNRASGGYSPLPSPKTDDLHNQWMSFHQSVCMPPALPPTMPPTPMPTMPTMPTTIPFPMSPQEIPNNFGNLVPLYYQSSRFYPQFPLNNMPHNPENARATEERQSPGASNINWSPL